MTSVMNNYTIRDLSGGKDKLKSASPAKRWRLQTLREGGGAVLSRTRIEDELRCRQLVDENFAVSARFAVKRY